jgi:prepilin-type N-terminal cleavage/methylation domain-containing protein/prepilin-type processing-associated H-X9-DG protein
MLGYPNGPGDLRNHSSAFTLLELAVVLGVFGILMATATLLYPEKGRKTGAIACMNNLKQLSLGYLMWSTDNKDQLLSSLSGPDPNGTPAWCEGQVTHLPDATDVKLLEKSPTYPYVTSSRVFRCPLDRSIFILRGQSLPRIRSYSVNGFLGHPGPVLELHDVVAPGPSMIYLFVEEHANSINDSQFIPFANMKGYTGQPWLSAPSGRHRNGAGFSFVDGHAEIHRWVSPLVFRERTDSYGTPPYDPSAAGMPTLEDFIWFTNHAAPFPR